MDGDASERRNRPQGARKYDGDRAPAEHLHTQPTGADHVRADLPPPDRRRRLPLRLRAHGRARRGCAARGLGRRSRRNLRGRDHRHRRAVAPAGRRGRDHLRIAHLHGRRLGRLPHLRRGHQRPLGRGALGGQACSGIHQLGLQERRQEQHPGVLRRLRRPAPDVVGQPGPGSGLELQLRLRARPEPPRLLGRSRRADPVGRRSRHRPQGGHRHGRAPGRASPGRPP